MQLAAYDLFGGTLEPLKNAHNMNRGQALYEEHSEAFREILQAQYDVTQKYFAEIGIESLTLYRGQRHPPKGMKSEKSDSGRLNIDRLTDAVMQPLSSFSSGPELAFKKPYVIIANFAVENIHSFSGTGLGTHLEKEVVVIGNLRGSMWLISGHSPYSISKDWLQEKLQEVDLDHYSEQ
jgi:hypothetical protein